MKFPKMILLCLLAVSVFCGCEEEDKNNSPSNSDITAKKEVIRINNNRTEIEVEGPLTLVLSDATLYKQRESCSGFDVCSVSEIDVGDTAEYSYYNVDDTDYSNRTITPYKIRFWRSSCQATEQSDQWLYDGDLDNYPDRIDAFPDDPTQH